MRPHGPIADVIVPTWIVGECEGPCPSAEWPRDSVAAEEDQPSVAVGAKLAEIDRRAPERAIVQPDRAGVLPRNAFWGWRDVELRPAVRQNQLAVSPQRVLAQRAEVHRLIEVVPTGLEVRDGDAPLDLRRCGGHLLHAAVLHVGIDAEARGLPLDLSVRGAEVLDKASRSLRRRAGQSRRAADYFGPDDVVVGALRIADAGDADGRVDFQPCNCVGIDHRLTSRKKGIVQGGGAELTAPEPFASGILLKATSTVRVETIDRHARA